MGTVKVVLDNAALAPAPDPTRDRLVESAARSFAEHGLEQVSLEAVARDAGMHRTTLHRHFPGGREELVLDVLRHEVAAVATHVYAAIEAAPDARVALVECLWVAVEMGRANRVVAAILEEPSQRAALLGPAAAEVRALGTVAWDLVLAHPNGGAEARAAGLASERVVNFVFRTLATLVSEPGPVVTSDDVRAYLADFVAPALIG